MNRRQNSRQRITDYFLGLSQSLCACVVTDVSAHPELIRVPMEKPALLSPAAEPHQVQPSKQSSLGMRRFISFADFLFSLFVIFSNRLYCVCTFSIMNKIVK